MNHCRKTYISSELLLLICFQWQWINWQRKQVCQNVFASFVTYCHLGSISRGKKSVFKEANFFPSKEICARQILSFRSSLILLDSKESLPCQKWKVIQHYQSLWRRKFVVPRVENDFFFFLQFSFSLENNYIQHQHTCN